MPKTIQWNIEFTAEVMSEKTGSIYYAVRPGRLYYDNEYFKKGDVVDIRIVNKVVRKAMIQDELRLAKIKDLTQMDYNLLKPQINTKEKLKDFLARRYNIDIGDSSEITIIPYNSMNLVYLKENVDPHFC